VKEEPDALAVARKGHVVGRREGKMSVRLRFAGIMVGERIPLDSVLSIRAKMDSGPRLPHRSLPY
jgi:hypothetical protein